MKRLLLSFISVLVFTGIAHAQPVSVLNTSGASTLCANNEQACPIAVDATGAIQLSASGATSSAHAEDSAHTTGDYGVGVLTKRTDVPASSAGTDGDYATLNTDSEGKLWIGGTSIEDNPEAGNALGMTAHTVRRDTPASSAGAQYDYATLNTDADGALWVDNIGKTFCATVTPTVDAVTAYASGDNVGGMMSLTTAFRSGVNTGRVTSIMITDEDSKGGNLEACFWAGSPAGTFTDNAATAPSDADIIDNALLLGCSEVTTHRAWSANGVSSVENISIPVVDTDTTLKMTLTAREAITAYSATNAIKAKVCIDQD